MASAKFNGEQAIRTKQQESNRERVMKSIILNVFADEQGTETIEYAFVLGLIIVAAMGVVGAFGSKCVAKWTSLNTGFH
jgi:Flp pilus assembly pilin Flp